MIQVGAFIQCDSKRTWEINLSLFSEMSGLALSNGSLLNVFQGKRCYQPVWQVMLVFPSSSGFSVLTCSQFRWFTLTCHLDKTSRPHIAMAASSWWVIIIWFFLPSFDSPPSQVSDGQYLTYNVALHPHCSVTFNKNTWKGQNGKRSPEDIISSYRFPTIKVFDKSVEVALCTFLF